LIFHEFYRAEQAQRSGPSGLGLGLAVAKQLVALHSGELGVRSPGDLGSGTTFFFALPMLADTAMLAEHASLPPPSHLEQRERRELILVIDDDPRILNLHCRLIEKTGREALRARNGREALAMLQQVQPDLILLDLMMPEMDGFATLDALHASQATRDIPVVVMTAQSLTEAEIERCNRGVAAVLNKGLFNTLETLNRIEHILAHRHTLGGPTRRLVRRAMAFVHAHYTEPLRREQIASHVAVSADYLADCFRQEFGVTPTTYLHRYRIHQARELLLTSDMTIAAVALAVGFSESAHFTRAFHREVGISPRAYRRSQPDRSSLER
jgi:AraC-like DNA-binding protein